MTPREARLEAMIRSVIEAFPWGEDEDINGGDLVEWMGQWTLRAKDSLRHDTRLPAELAFDHLREALALLAGTGAVKTAARVRLAISSARGAVRHARLAPYREERRARRTKR